MADNAGHLVVIHPTSVPWRVYLLTCTCTLFLLLRIVIKATRKTLRQSLVQEIFLILGWSSTIAMTYLIGYSFHQNGTDLTQFLLICNYLYIVTSHCIKIAIALLFVKIGDIKEYHIINRLLVPIIACSFAGNILFLTLECHLTHSSTCKLQPLTYFQTTTNALLGLMLAIHPLRPLYHASKCLDRHNIILLALLFSTGLAESACSLARAFVTSGTLERHKNHYLTRIQVLCFWLMLETTLSIVIAVTPELGGSILHVFNCRQQATYAQVRSRSTSDASNTTQSTWKSGWDDDGEAHQQAVRDYERIREELLGTGHRWPEARIKHFMKASD